MTSATVQGTTGEAAAHSAAAMAAQAYTVGSAVVFGAGRYAPETASGRHLLAHELAHVVQQRAGGVGLQRRAANCPETPPSPPTIKTMDDFIALVKRVEASTMQGGDPIATARLIARTKYEGRAWDWMLPSTKGQPGVSQDRYGVGQVTADDVGSLCFELIAFTMPGGGQEDPMHLIAAIVADAETQPAGTGASGLSRIPQPLPASVSQRGASPGSATWAKPQLIGCLIRRPAKVRRRWPTICRRAPPHDLMADVDGVAITDQDHAVGLGIDRTKPLSRKSCNASLPRRHTWGGSDGDIFTSFALPKDSAWRRTASRSPPPRGPRLEKR